MIQGSMTCLIRVSPACSFRHACLIGQAVTQPGQTSVCRGNVASRLREGAGSQAEPTCCLKLPLCVLVASAQRFVFPCLGLPASGKRERDESLSSRHGVGAVGPAGSTSLDCFCPLIPRRVGLATSQPGR